MYLRCEGHCDNVIGVEYEQIEHSEADESGNFYEEKSYPKYRESLNCSQNIRFGAKLRLEIWVTHDFVDTSRILGCALRFPDSSPSSYRTILP
jgi:hypothetical protein